MSRRLIFGAVLLAPVCISGMAQADTEAFKPAAVYSTKFLCGFQRTPATGGAAAGAVPTREPAVKPGNYATAINVQNFHLFQVTFCKRAVLAPAERCYEKQGDDSCLKPVVGTPVRFSLSNNQAVSIDCKDIVTLLGGTTSSFIEGFVEIMVVPQANLPPSNPLSVTGVYTSLGCNLTPGVSECPRLDGAGLDVVPQNSFAGEFKECAAPN